VKDKTVSGRKAENFACSFLKKQGLILLSRNYRCRFGEIDIIMRHCFVVIFVEVRLRNCLNWCSGAESVDYAKQKRLIKTAESFLQHFSFYHVDFRFDVIALHQQEGTFKINWVKHAFMV